MKPIIAVTFVLALVALGSGCATTSNTNRLSIGMTKQEVVAAMGQPTSAASPGNGVEILRYDLSSAVATVILARHGIASNPQDYFVKLIDGKVTSYGKVGDFDSTKDPTLNVIIQNK